MSPGFGFPIRNVCLMGKKMANWNGNKMKNANVFDFF